MALPNWLMPSTRFGGEEWHEYSEVYGCRGCETAPVTAGKPVQLIEKSMASPSVLAMSLTTKYVDCLPLHRFEI